MSIDENTATAPVVLDDIKKMRREIIRFLWLRGRPPLEQSTSAEELLYLVNAVKRTGARTVAEIGFNAGFSAYAFLSANPDVHMVSFDLGEHAYTRTAKGLIDRKFPGRHTVVYGDSTLTVPDYHAKNPDTRFDLIFIDGGHSYEVAKADITNMRPFSTGTTAVVIDDLTPWKPWGKGPTKAWNEAIDDGWVVQEELYKDGAPVEVMEPPGKRSWALGRYVPATS